MSLRNELQMRRFHVMKQRSHPGQVDRNHADNLEHQSAMRTLLMEGQNDYLLVANKSQTMHQQQIAILIQLVKAIKAKGASHE